MCRCRIVLAATVALLAPAARGQDAPDGASGPLLPRLPVVGVAADLRVEPSIGELRWTGDAFEWRHTVAEPDAFFLKVHFSRFRLAGDERVEIVDARGRLRETLTGRGPKDRGDFWSLPVRGSRLTVRFVSPRSSSRRPFLLDRVLVGDSEPAAAPPPWDWAELQGSDGVCRPSDLEDVACYAQDPLKWSNIAASAGVLWTGNGVSLFCSGVALDGDLLLTSAHCVDTQAECDDTDFVFRYWRTGCDDGSPPIEDWVAFRCDELLVTRPFESCDAGAEGLDFSLFSVEGEPSAEFGGVTPDRRPLADGEPVYIVQHPEGRPHRIAHGSGGAVDADGAVLRYSDTLDTAPGSSGAPIFRESDGGLVGLHRCGGCALPGVGNRGVPMSEIHPLIEPFLDPSLFADGFESGDLEAWDEKLDADRD